MERNVDNGQFDVVVIGSGLSGSIVAAELGSAGKKVLIIEAGPAVPDNRGEYMQNFYMNPLKAPEAAYPPLTLDPANEATPRATIGGLINSQDPTKSYLIQPAPSKIPDASSLPFSSTYERVGGGTMWHWLGTSLRLVPHDLQMYTQYGVFSSDADWPISYDTLSGLYEKAESEIGVSASVAEQAPLGPAIGLKYRAGYQYPMNPIPMTLVDEAVSKGSGGVVVDSKPVFVSPTPAGRNSQPYQSRRVCAGNTNCIPICPIQAKYDPSVTLARALNTGNVTVSWQSVATKLLTDANGKISGVQYVTWDKELNPTKGAAKIAQGAMYVLAAHAIENAKLLLLSKSSQFPNGIANYSDQVGRNLMDHVLYLSWALTPEGQPVYPYRGPLATAGIESLRDGAFRSQRAAYRIEIGNEGWNFAIGDPNTTVLDFINGTNNSRTNPPVAPGQPTGKPGPALGGPALAMAVNDRLTRQFRLGCLIEQAPQCSNRVTLDDKRTDGLGLQRPKISYGFDAYTLAGFKSARETCSAVYKAMGATEFTDYSNRKGSPSYFEIDGEAYSFFGAGHIIGTHRMGNSKKHSVVDANQKSHDHANLWIMGSGSFPTESTPNPSLTIAALAFATAADLKSALK
jgi:choline dehydrogenase-like flavoprotein